MYLTISDSGAESTVRERNVVPCSSPIPTPPTVTPARLRALRKSSAAERAGFREKRPR